MIVLGKQEVLDLVDMAALIGAVESALIELSAGTAINPNRLRIFVPERQAMMACMPGYLGGAGVLGAKVVASSSRAVPPGAPRPMSALILLADTEGRFLSVMCGTQLGALRTAAASAVAIRHLARPEASVMAVIGCGVQGRAELAAAMAVRPLSRVYAYDIDPVKAASFQREMSALHGIEIVVAADAGSAVSGADIVALATTAAHPVVPDEAVRPGTHINAVGAHTPATREMHGETVARGLLFVESRPAILAEAGDVLIPLREGRFAEAHILGELGDVAAGVTPGRSTPQDVTIFKSTGVAVEDVVAARLIYEAALARGVGLRVAM